MSRKFVDETIERYCAFCEYGTPVPQPDGTCHIICKKKGLVRDTYVCGRFKYDPLKREPRPKKKLPDFHVENLDGN